MRIGEENYEIIIWTYKRCLKKVILIIRKLKNVLKELNELKDVLKFRNIKRDV